MRHDIVNDEMLNFYKNNKGLVPSKDEIFDMQYFMQKSMLDNYYEQSGSYSEESNQFLYRYYWIKGLALIAFGLRAMSYVGTLRFDKHSSFEAYRWLLNRNILPIIRFRKREEKEEMYRMLFLRLQLKEGLKYDDFRKRFNKDYKVALTSVTSRLKQHKLVEEYDQGIRLTQLGKFFTQETCCIIMDYAIQEMMPYKKRISVCADERTNSWLNRRAEICELIPKKNRFNLFVNRLKDLPLRIGNFLLDKTFLRSIILHFLSLFPIKK
jgi:coproporphyrinogen III oxidase-like Fe-S oxidoreductase